MQLRSISLTVLMTLALSSALALSASASTGLGAANGPGTVTGSGAAGRSSAAASSHTASFKAAAASQTAKKKPQLFTTGAKLDYQIGGSYKPPKGVGIVVRDHSEKPAPGLYSVCYINGFQTQPGQKWSKKLILHVKGKPFKDENWPDEYLLDTSTKTKRNRIVAKLRPWIKSCAQKGFQAVEFDNLDTFTRSHKKLSLKNNIALAKELTKVAHKAGLAVAQKNASEYSKTFRRKAGFDFAISEGCAAYKECHQYAKVYGKHVLNIEYTDHMPRKFAAVCGHKSTPKSTVLRDRNLKRPQDKGYRFALCPLPKK